MSQIIDGAFKLGLAGFILLIVLIILLTMLSKMTCIFTAIPEKFDLLTDKLAESNKNMTTQLINSNKELSCQLTKTLVIQENILAVMKETIVTINNNSVKIAILENKLDNNHEAIQEISKKTDATMRELKEIKNLIIK